jgi:hypothetical protein
LITLRLLKFPKLYVDLHTLQDREGSLKQVQIHTLSQPLGSNAQLNFVYDESQVALQSAS